MMARTHLLAQSPWGMRLALGLLFALLSILSMSTRCVRAFDPTHHWASAANSSMPDGSEIYTEELLVRPLDDTKGSVLTLYHFTTRWAAPAQDEWRHFNLFPKAIGLAVSKFGVEEMHLAFTQGRWIQEEWGHNVRPAAIGAELAVWFSDESDGGDAKHDADGRWKGLSQTLSGIFCASLNQLDETKTCSSRFAQKTGSRPIPTAMRYGNLPREPVCTENLTPWKKLLPCHGVSGLSAFLRSIPQAEASYRSIQLDFRWLRGPSGDHFVELVLSSSSVHKRGTLSRAGDGGRMLALNRVLKSGGARAVDRCPLASEAVVYLDMSHLPDGKARVVENTSAPTHVLHLEPPRGSNSMMALYDANSHWSELLDARFQWQSPRNASGGDRDGLPSLGAVARGRKGASGANVRISRSVTGFGQERGVLSIKLDNEDEEISASVTHFATFPWYFRLYLHTIRVTLNGEALVHPMAAFSSFHFVPSEDRADPAVLEFHLKMEPNDHLVIALDYELGYMDWTEFPPDPHRGFDVGSAYIDVVPMVDEPRLINGLHGLEWSPYWHGADHATPRYRTYSAESMLVDLPTPDFSMPYNVLTLTGAAMAFFFAWMFSTLTARMEDRLHGPQGLWGIFPIRVVVGVLYIVWSVVYGLYRWVAGFFAR